MRYFSRTCLVVVAVLALSAGLRLDAQAPDQPAGQGRGGGRGGYGGGRMGQPVRGIVTAATASKVTIKTDAGDSYDVTLGDNARVMKAGQTIGLGDIKAGDSVTAMGQVDATRNTVQASMVVDIDAATVAKAKENLGKTYITGKITAIDADNLKITVTRTDTVNQVIAVDDGTSFQRGTRGVAADIVAAGGLPVGGGFGGGRGRGGGGQGGGVQAAPPVPESITLADIKVGDSLMATGALKSGTFTVLKMGVSESGAGPGAGEGRRRGTEQQAPPGPPAPAPSAPPQ